MTWNRNLLSTAVVAIAASVLVAGGSARAATMFTLGNHPDGDASSEGGYGLRVDDASGINTFNFESAGAGVVFEITGSDSATISGVVEHNQSGQLWQITANLSSVVTTNKVDGGAEPWFDISQPNALYDGVVEDLITFGDTTYGDGDMNLKMLAFDADRIGFYVNDVTLEYVGDPNDAVFDADGNDDGLLSLVAYPGGDPTMLPMIVAKGHRLDAATDQLVGLGWLEEEGAWYRKYTRDFLFTFGEPIPEPSSAALFAVGALLCGGAVRRRS